MTRSGHNQDEDRRIAEALEKCKEVLRLFAETLGADAVVCSRFETHFDSRAINVSGFDTAVRWK